MAVQAAESIRPQADGAQREPSMEEILASIRRIIEDSDQVRKQDAPEATDDNVDDVDLRSFSDDLKPAAEIAARKEAPARDRSPTQQEISTSPAPSGSAPARAGANARGSLEGHAKNALDVPSREHDTLPKREEAAAPSDNSVALDEEMDAGLLSAGGEVAAASQIDHSPQKWQASEASKSVAVAPSSRQQDNVGSIISKQAGLQVAAAFDELSEAFAASRRRSFDDIAAEMMRPMLQEWMDNNLPTLVERLVREEIERVARGQTG